MFKILKYPFFFGAQYVVLNMAKKKKNSLMKNFIFYHLFSFKLFIKINMNVMLKCPWWRDYGCNQMSNNWDKIVQFITQKPINH